MSTLIPPPSKKQKRDAQQPRDVEIIPTDLPNVLIKFQASDTGESIGGSIRVPGAITELQLEELLNQLNGTSDDPVPYTFSLETEKDLVDIKNNLYTSVLKPGLKTTEDFMTLVYTPRAIFKVQPVTRASATITGHGSTILAAQFAPNTSDSLVTGAGDSTARIWDCNTQTIKKTLNGHSNWVLCVQWSPKGDVIATGSMDSTIRLWDAKNGECLGTLTGHGKWITYLSWEPIHMVEPGKKPRLVSSSKDGSIKIWDTGSMRCLMTMSGHSSSVSCVKWGGLGLIYSASHDKTIRVWDAKDGKCLQVLKAHAHWVNHLALSTDYALRVGAFDYKSETPKDEKDEQERAKKNFEKVAKSGGKLVERLVTASDDFTMFLWEPSKSNKPLCRMTGHQKLVNHVSFSPDGRYVSSASFDNSIKLWDGRDGKFIATFRGHVAPVYQTSWSSDCRLLVSCSKDTTLKVWDVKTRKLMSDLPGHLDEIYTVDWSVDGKRVASGGKDKTVLAALLPEFGIGYKGQLPWSLKQEMKYFRKLTTTTIDPTKKNAVIMGRKTYHSIPPKFRPLKNRINIVLTRNVEQLSEEMKDELDTNHELLRISNSLPDILDNLKTTDNIEEIFIIGGAEVYNQLMCDNHDIIDSIYLTEIENDKKLEMDAFFNLNKSIWIKSEETKLTEYLQKKELHEEFQLNDNKENEFSYSFTLWEKKH
ncbi:ribosome assembly [Pichia californica]|nr:ribosome assembly [[Candida] californica]